MIEHITISETKKRELERGMKNLVARVALDDPSVHWEYEVYGTDFFPFRAYASAVQGIGPNAEEALVVGLQCHRPGGTTGPQLFLYADICREDGTVLAESSKYEITLAPSVDTITPRIPSKIAERGATAVLEYRTSTAIRSLQLWLIQQVALLRMALSEPHGSDLDKRLEALNRLSAHAARVRREMAGKRRPTSRAIILQVREETPAA